MAESAALLVGEVFPEKPVRPWVLSVPYPLRFLFASRLSLLGQAVKISTAWKRTPRRVLSSRPKSWPTSATDSSGFGANATLYF